MIDQTRVRDGAVPLVVHPLKAARLRRNLTQQMLADFTGLSVPTIKRAEGGKPVSLDVRRVLCEYFGQTADTLGLFLGAEGQPVSMACRREGCASSMGSAPFADGRLLWSLSLGIRDGGLQCLISCPLSSGESWEIALDPVADRADIQCLYRLVQEQVLTKGIKRVQEETLYPSNVLHFALVDQFDQAGRGEVTR